MLNQQAASYAHSGWRSGYWLLRLIAPAFAGLHIISLFPAALRTTLHDQGQRRCRPQGPGMGIFHDVAKALTSSLDLDSILQTIMEKMAEYFKPDNWSLLMVDEEREELYFAIVVGKAAEALKNVRLKVGEGIAGWVAKARRTCGSARRLHRSAICQAHR